MHTDPMLVVLVGAAAMVLVIGMVLRGVGQPQVVAYLLAGVALGPDGLALFTDEVGMARAGEFGVVLLLFFIGMEVSLPALIRGWRVAIVGTLLQVALSVAGVFAVGHWLGWPIERVILMGFVISLSSTAVVVSMLRARNELDTEAGRDALGILLVQDVLIVVMLITMSFLAGEAPDAVQISMQAVGAVAIGVVLTLVARGTAFRLPFAKRLTEDHELQVFAAMLGCFGAALLTGVLGLSTALGAFVAGIVIGANKSTDWVHHSLEPFRVVFVALFFVSVGMLIDLDFLADEWRTVALLVGLALVTNTLLNASILRALGRRWRHSIYVGSLLAQVGEFSFVLAAVGKQSGLISDYGYQLTVLVIALSLLASPAWVSVYSHRPKKPA